MSTLLEQQELGPNRTPRVERPVMTPMERILHARAERNAKEEREAKEKKNKREKRDIVKLAALVDSLLGPR